MTSEEREGLRNIRHWRSWTWILLVGYVPLVWAVKSATRLDLAAAPVILIWVVCFLRCLSRLAFSRCPRCGGFFHSVNGTPAFFNVLARKCLQCGLRLKTDRVIYPSMES